MLSTRNPSSYLQTAGESATLHELITQSSQEEIAHGCLIETRSRHKLTGIDSSPNVVATSIMARGTACSTMIRSTEHDLQDKGDRALHSH